PPVGLPGPYRCPAAVPGRHLGGSKPPACRPGGSAPGRSTADPRTAAASTPRKAATTGALRDALGAGRRGDSADRSPTPLVASLAPVPEVLWTISFARGETDEGLDLAPLLSRASLSSSGTRRGASSRPSSSCG